MKVVGSFRKEGLGLLPRDGFARKIIAALKEGDWVLVEVWKPRNHRQHRKYFAVLNNVVEATGRWASTEHLRRDILLSLGRYDEHVSALTGEVTKVPHSMSYASMDKDEFEALYAETINLLTEALGCDPEALMEGAA